jgi:PAS domain S-box-containing protein
VILSSFSEEGTTNLATMGTRPGADVAVGCSLGRKGASSRRPRDDFARKPGDDVKFPTHAGRIRPAHALLIREPVPGHRLNDFGEAGMHDTEAIVVDSGDSSFARNELVLSDAQRSFETLFSCPSVLQATDGCDFIGKLIRSIPGLFYVLDEDFRLRWWNKNLEVLTGYPPQELAALPVPQLLFRDEHSRSTDALLRASFAHGEGVAEASIRSKDGRETPFLFTLVRIRRNEKFYVVGVGTDLTDSKQKENRLRETLTLYQTLTDRTSVGVVLYNQSQLLFANPAFAAMFGFRSIGELVGKDTATCFSGAVENAPLDILKNLEHGKTKERHFQTPWPTTAGRERWIDGQATIVQWNHSPAVLLSVMDITEAKRREEWVQEEAENLRKENLQLRSSIRDRFRLGNLIGKSAAMQSVYEQIFNAAITTANVILCGESGTGKELVAKVIHEISARSREPFVAVNCAAIPENLLESEFFGHKKGAFTNALADKPGYLDIAAGGTLFLDEVGDLSLGLQAKLLRAIDGGGYVPVGGTVPKYSDFRIVAATHKDLLDEVRRGRLRKDFFYRIYVIPITLPPLRDRKEDIPLLLEYFVKRYSRTGKIIDIPGPVIEALFQYDWPGNVRELQNAVQRYLATQSLEFISSPPQRRHAEVSCGTEGLPATDALGLSDAVDSSERQIIRRALDHCRGKKGAAANVLGVSRKTLFRKMKRLNLEY